MRKTTTLLLLLFAALMQVAAQQRSMSEVMQIASEQIATIANSRPTTGNGLKMVGSTDVVKSSDVFSTSELNSSDEVFYIVNNSVNGEACGYVIIAADQRMSPVLGYSDNGSLNAENMPCNLREWLRAYAYELQEMEQGESVMLKDKTPAVTYTGSVSPICQTEWDQSSPYNNACPTISGKRTVTGCEATVMAQIMKVYNYPTHGTGSTSYTTNKSKLNVSVDYSTLNFDWNNMLDSYKGTYSSNQASAVANLMFACGASVSMDYGTSGSSAYGSDCPVALIKYFGYDKDMAYIERNSMTTDDWHSLLINELKSGRPIFYDGRTTSNSGHAFIFDGYQVSDNEPYYHVNWGWSGTGNGYYRISNLKPSGTNEGNYCYKNDALINIMPDNGICDISSLLQAESITLSPKRMMPQELKDVTIGFNNIFNRINRKFQGDVYLYLVGEGKEYLLGKTSYFDGLDYEKGYSYHSFKYSMPQGISEGEYKLEVRSKATGSTTYDKVYCGNGSETLVISSKKEVYYPNVMVTALNCTVKNKNTISVSAPSIMNYATMAFSGTIRMMLCDAEGDTIQQIGNNETVNGLSRLSYLTYPRTFEGKLPDQIKDGKYRIYLMANQEGYDGWSKVTGYSLSDNKISETGKECHVLLDVKGGEATISEEDLPVYYPNIMVTDFTIQSKDVTTRKVTTRASQICNFDNSSFIGKVSLAVADAKGNFVKAFGTATEISSTMDHYSYLTYPRTIEGVIPELQDGAYRLCLAANRSGYRGWSIVKKYTMSGGYIRDKGLDCYTEFWVIDGKLTFERPAFTLSLDKKSLTLKVGDSSDLNVSINPSYAADNDVSWSSSDTKVATVSQKGSISAVGVGKAIVKAISKYNNNVYDECFVTVEAILVNNIQLSKSEVELEEGESVTLTATVSPTTATVKELTWTSNNTTVATVSNGVVKALKEGTATITAMAKDGSGVKASAKITVKHTVLVSSISFSKDIQIIKPNETLTLTPTIAPADATDKTLQWTSSSTKIATVTNGVVKGISGGMVTITAKAMDNSNVSASCKVIVDGPITGGSTETIPVCSLELDTHNKTMKVSEKVSLTANILPTIASNKQVTWNSSDTKVATVNSSGLVIATGIGKATIKATSKYDSKIFDECEVTVEATPVESIKLSKNDVKLEEGESVTLTATVSPATATVKDVTWTSSNEDVAMVSKSGKVLAVKAGTATITAMATDGSGVKATATVTVTPVMVKSIALNHTSFSLEKGESITLELTIAPANAANKKVTWSSSNEDVVMVSSTGRCICLGEGTATVTATTTDGSNLSATCVFNCTDGIITITMDDDSDIKVYDIEGRKLSNLKKGVNIIRMDDGTTRKVVKK